MSDDGDDGITISTNRFGAERLAGGPLLSSFACPRCGMTSHNPRDAEQGYCGNCHDWTGAGGV